MEYSHVENELGKVRTEKSFLKDMPGNMIASSVREKKVQSKSCNKFM